jgi:hypothetical protein
MRRVDKMPSSWKRRSALGTILVKQCQSSAEETCVNIPERRKAQRWPIQRRWVRVPINVRLQLWYEREGIQQQYHCRSFDISEGGMGLMSPYELELDQVVDLEFSLPEAMAPLKLQAVIRSKIGFRVGCEFVLPTEKQQADIARYGNALQPSRLS